MSGICEERKEYLRNYQREWVRKRRTSWIESNGPCKHCGSYEDLEVDHIDHNSKEIPIRCIWSRKESIRIKELSKCQVLCSRCHKEKTKLEGSRHKNVAKGEKVWSSKLSEDRVREILKLKGKMTIRAIGEKFGVSHASINDILKGKKWKHVK